MLNSHLSSPPVQKTVDRRREALYNLSILIKFINYHLQRRDIVRSINRPELVKEYNLKLVQKQLFELRKASRQQLSALTGISNVTMGSLLQQLLDSGEALETEKLQPASGRPASIYAYNADRQRVLLLSVVFEGAGRHFQASLLNLYGEALWEESRPAACLGYAETKEYVGRLLHLAEPVGAVGIGLPGVGFGEYFHQGRAAEYLSLQALEELQEESGIPFQLENDVNLAAMGYAAAHEIGPDSALAYLYLMKGTYGGSAIYLNGRLHLGNNRFAGELLPPPYGADWPGMSERPAKQLEDALFLTLLPYLSILAPHRLVVASDYILPRHLEAVAGRLAAALDIRHCPDCILTESFREDYQNGLKKLALEQLPFPVGREAPEAVKETN